jgi:hypothetical protein
MTDSANTKINTAYIFHSDRKKPAQPVLPANLSPIRQYLPVSLLRASKAGVYHEYYELFRFCCMDLNQAQINEVVLTMPDFTSNQDDTQKNQCSSL